MENLKTILNFDTNYRKKLIRGDCKTKTLFLTPELS